jgi:fumarylacetoacetate (FAA) hydrolase
VKTARTRRGLDVPEEWYRIPVFYFSNPNAIYGPEAEIPYPEGTEELDYELEVAAIIGADEQIAGFTVLNDWSARDLQREETTVRLGPAKGKDFATTIGPWLVTPDDLADARQPGTPGPNLAMTAGVNGQTISRGTWTDAQFSFGDMLARASADARLRPGDVIGSGTVGTGCLLEVKDQTLGRYLEPGDDVVLRIDRLGELRTPIVERPS